MKTSRLFLIACLSLSFGFTVHAQSQKTDNTPAVPDSAASCPKGTIAQHNHNMERAAGSGKPRCVTKGTAKAAKKSKGHNQGQFHKNQ